MAEEWSQLECEAIVRDYFEMFRMELIGQEYSKAAHRRTLQPLLNNRSEGSIEYKHQNISAILLEAGFPYVQGYKPAFNYQGILRDVVLVHLSAQSKELNDLVATLSETVPEEWTVAEWSKVLDEAPVKIQDHAAEQTARYVPRTLNFAELEAGNRKLGKRGEQFVLEYERFRLKQAGRADLAREVEWTSVARGDGTGYDIRSFDETRDVERFIEVKTTNSGKFQPFLITDNELAFSASQEDRYCLYRVYAFRSEPRLFLLPGNVKLYVNLTAKLYRASF